MKTEFRFDHLSLSVRNLADSVRFYRDILGFPEIENKTKRPTIRWLGFDGARAIHLIAGAGEALPERPRSAHFCISTPKFDETLAWLHENGVCYVNLAGERHSFNRRGDGVRQAYFQDPDNYWIEVCESDADGKVG